MVDDTTSARGVGELAASDCSYSRQRPGPSFDLCGSAALKNENRNGIRCHEATKRSAAPDYGAGVPPASPDDNGSQVRPAPAAVSREIGRARFADNSTVTASSARGAYGPEGGTGCPDREDHLRADEAGGRPLADHGSACRHAGNRPVAQAPEERQDLFSALLLRGCAH